MSENIELMTDFAMAALLYRLIEKEDELPLDVSKTDFAPLSSEVKKLCELGAIEKNADSDTWKVTQKGETIFDSMFDVCESMLDLDIFAAVNLSLELPEELFDEEGLVVDGELDPRFEEPVDEEEAEELGTTDLRLVVIDFLAEQTCQSLDVKYDDKLRRDVLSRVVFLQELGNDLFDDDQTFYDMKNGDIEAQTEEIVSSIPPWTELAREFSPPESLMEMILISGFRDAAKRDFLSEVDNCVWLDPQKQSKIIEQMLQPLVR